MAGACFRWLGDCRGALAVAFTAERVVPAGRADGGDPEEGVEGHPLRLKRAPGARGPAWWVDGAPDLNRHLARNTAYADWFSKSARSSTEGT